MITFVMQRLVVICTAIVLITGCRSIPPYKGDGQISNTTHWDDNLVRVRQYTIQLPSFPLNENREGEFHLGDVAFFRNTRFGVSLRFQDNCTWRRFSHLPDSMKTRDYVAEYRLRDIDSIGGRMSFQVLDASGKPLLQSDQLLKDLVWSQSGAPENGWSQVALRDKTNNAAAAPKAEDLNLRYSYMGDPSLTNRGSFVIELWPR